MPLFNRQQRLNIFKFWSLLSLVRWYSILAVVVAQYLASLFLLNTQVDKWELLFDFELHLTIVATACIIASGFIINAFYDLEKDSINRPDKVIFSRLVSQRTCLNAYFFFNTIGMVLSFYVSKRIMLFNFLFSVALWFFSHKLKKKAYLSEISAAMLTLTPFMVVLIHYQQFSFNLFLYLSFMGLVILIREVLKDLIAQKGDAIYGYETLPIKVGEEATKGALKLFMLLTLLPFIVLVYMNGFSLVMGYFLLGEIMILTSIFFLEKATTSRHYQNIDRAYKLLMIAGILSIPLV